MKLRERLLQLLGRRDYVPLDRGGIASRLGLGKAELRKLDFELRALLGAGTVVPGSLLSRASLRVREREGERRE